MCDVFQDKFDHGYREGRAQERFTTIENYISSTMSLIKETGWSVEKALSVMCIPDDLRFEVTSEVQRRLIS